MCHLQQAIAYNLEKVRPQLKMQVNWDSPVGNLIDSLNMRHDKGKHGVGLQFPQMNKDTTNLGLAVAIWDEKVVIQSRFYRGKGILPEYHFFISNLARRRDIETGTYMKPNFEDTRVFDIAAFVEQVRLDHVKALPVKQRCGT